MAEMSENHCRPVRGADGGKAQKYERLKGKSIERLTDEYTALLRRAASGDIDLELTRAYLDAMDEKEPIPFALEETATYERFAEKHAAMLEELDRPVQSMELHASEQQRPVEKRSRGALRRTVPVAAAAALILGTMISAQAMGVDVFGKIARWTEETFHFSSVEQAAVITKYPLAEGERMTFETLEDAVDAFGITAPIVPKRIPDGLSLTGVTALYNASGIEIYAAYEGDGDAELFAVDYREVAAGGETIVEKDASSVGLYERNGIGHYLITDKGCEKAIWQNGELECFMAGMIARQEMREIIDSIYEE